MSGMKDHYYGDQPYPLSPGFKEPTTSRTAARMIAPNARTLCALVLRTIRESADGLTADEAAAIIRLNILTVRPRVSELREQGKVIPSGRRRKNESGMSATVWIDSGKALRG